jgi:hydrogenase maturation protein HypF
MSNSRTQSSPLHRLAITVRGVIQGVGFRPFVYNAARSKGLCGWVLNEADLVRMEVQGDRAALDDFLDSLQSDLPPQARIDEIDIRELPCEKDHPAAFEIRTSLSQSAPQPTIPADLATCDQCLAEIRDPSQRRHGYPFTNCTNCGPRWSIIEQLPYDRSRTSMAGFQMCLDCRAEYENPADRRFHAQPIACPKCGPHLELLYSSGKHIARAEEAIAMAADMALESCVLAMKGLGGFQLVVDATSAEAVARLRDRKHRPDRPFALMMASLDEVRRHCEVSADEAAMLTSHQAPIVLLKRLRVAGTDANPIQKREGAYEIADGVAPGNPYLGVMLPYTPLHHLLLAAIGRPIVCTSGNLSEDPMAISTEEAIARLGSIADVILTHNRPIVRPVDDSIVRLSPGGLQVLRRARGFAPLPVRLNLAAPTILAVGGHLKNTVALCLGRVHEVHQETDKTRHPEGARCEAAETVPYMPAADESVRCTHPTEETVHRMHPTAQVVMSPHIGDLDNILSVQVFQRAIKDLVGFFAVKPDVVVCDMHPDYASTREAESLAAEWDAPLLRVQHHHAHAAAAMAEHGLKGPALALTWDGTGYGLDGTIWGGEVLRCEGSEFSRVSHLRTFALPGGDKAMHEPRRSALGLLYEVLGKEAGRFAAIWFNEQESGAIMRMLNQGLNCPRTSSMGRLFDAVAALCGRPGAISFEGQAAMSLEFAADEEEQSAYPIALCRDESQVLTADWEPMLRAILADLVQKVPVGLVGARFHNALAEMAQEIAEYFGIDEVVLSGGCFQNALLSKLVYKRLHKAGFTVYSHREAPPGDGGVALGQVYVAAMKGFRVRGSGFST